MNLKNLRLAFLSVTLLAQITFSAFATDLPTHDQPQLDLELSENQLLALNPLFKGKEELSLLCALLMLKSRVLSNARFNGMYGTHQPSYLTHPAITHPHGGHVPTIEWDSPLDDTSSLLQQLLPSPAGGTLLVPGSQHDLFRVMPVELLAALEKLYVHEKKRGILDHAPSRQQIKDFWFLRQLFPKDMFFSREIVTNCMFFSCLSDLRTAQFSSFKSFFDDCFENWAHRHEKGSRQKAGTEDKWMLTHKECLQLDAQWHNQLLDPTFTYATLFTNAIAEADLYPKNLIESALLALLWKRLNHVDIAHRSQEAFLDCMMTLCNDQNWKDPSIPLAFSKNYYMAWKDKNIDQQGQLNPEAFKRLLKEPEELVYLTILFKTHEQPHSENAENHAQFFKACFDRVVQGAGKRNIKKLRRTLNNYAPQFEDFFSQACATAVTYPQERLDTVLLTLAQRKMCHEGVAKKTLSTFTISLCPLENSLNPARYTKDLYMAWKMEALDNCGFLKPEALDDLLKKPEDLVFMTLMYDVYDNPFPQILGTDKAKYTYTDEQGVLQTISFSDCGEASVLSFLNTTIGDFKLRIFLIDLLQQFFPNAHAKLIHFYKEIQPIFEKINASIIGRSHWANVTSGLNEPGDADPIVYVNPEAQCEIMGSGDTNGLDNMLRVLGKLLGEPFTQLFPEELETNKGRAKTFTYLLKKMSFIEENDSSDSEDSDDEVGLTWHIKEKDTGKLIKDSLPNYAEVIIKRDGDELFKWSFGDGHFQFQRAYSQQEIDWRHLSLESLQKVIDSNLPEVFKAHLMPFFVPQPSFAHHAQTGVITFQDPLQYEEMKKQYEENKKLRFPFLCEQGYLLEAIFGEDLGGAEQKLSMMDKVITMDPSKCQPLFINWVKKMPDDRAINIDLTCFFYKHRNYFSPEALESLGQTFQNKIKSTMFILENELTCQIFTTLMENPYSHNLLEHLYENLSDHVLNAFVHERDSNECTPLMSNIYMNNMRHNRGFSIETKWIKKFLDHGADVNARDPDGSSVLSYAINMGEISLLLLQHPQIDAVDAKKVIEEKENHSPWMLDIISCNQVRLIEILLKDYKIDPNKQFENNYSSPPFFQAVKHGNLDIIDLFLADERTNPNMLSGNDGHQQTPLTYSLSAQKTEITEKLLQDKRVDPNMPDGQGTFPVNYVYPNENWAIADKLLENPQFDPNIKMRNEHNLLIYCLKYGYEDFAVKLCNHRKIELNIPDSQGHDPLFWAFEYDRWKVMDKLLDFEVIDPNVKNSRGDTPLTYLSSGGRLECFIKLCNHPKIDRNLANANGKAPLVIAANPPYGAPHWEIVEKLLEYPEVDLNVTNEYGYTLLFLACQHKNWVLADKLNKDLRVNPNVTDINGNTQLAKAIPILEVAGKLLEHPQIDPNVKIEDKFTLLTYCLKWRYKDFALKLCNHKKLDPNLPDSEGNYPISLAWIYEAWEVINKFLENPLFDPNIRMQSGDTLLTRCIKQKYKDLDFALNVCKHKNLDPNIPDSEGKYPIVLTCAYGAWEAFDKLLEFDSINLNVKFSSGETLFTSFIRESCLSQDASDRALKLCVHPNTDRNLTNDNSLSPLIMACLYKNWDVVEKLLEYPEVNLNVTNSNGMTPRSIALSYGKNDIAEKFPEF